MFSPFISVIASKLKGDLLIIGDFNYPTIDWEQLSTPHNINHCASKFLEIIQSSFLHQVVDSPTYHRPNQNPTLIDLIFSSNDHAVSNLYFHSPLGKSHHKILKFDYYIKDINKKERERLMYHKANYQGMRDSLQNVNWDENLKNICRRS